MAYLFGDQLILTLLAFGAVIWTLVRLVTNEVPLLGLVVLTFASAMFLSDFSVFLNADFTGALAVMAVLVLFVRYAFRLSLAMSAAVVAVFAVVGAASVYNLF